MREYVKVFAEAMEKKLQEHDEDKGEEGWLNAHTTVRWLIERLEEEVCELRQAFDDCEAENVKKECIDIANFAMMIRTRTWEQNRPNG